MCLLGIVSPTPLNLLVYVNEYMAYTFSNHHIMRQWLLIGLISYVFVILDLALDWEMHNDYYLAVHFVAILLAYYHQGCKKYIV